MSMIVHLTLVIVLALVVFSVSHELEGVVLNISPSDQFDDRQQLTELVMSTPNFSAPLAEASAGDVESIETAPAASVEAPAESIEVPTDVDLTGSAAPLPSADLLASLPSGDLFAPLGIAEAGESSVIIDGPPIRSAETPAAAINGLGGDIVGRLESGNVLVVWMFDASLSMHGDRIAAGRQMGVIFRELSQRLSDSSYRARHSLVCFGKHAKPMCEPTDRWTRVVKEVSNIPNDKSGVEKVFTTLQHAIRLYRQTWSDQLLFVIWTDESGNDVDQLEATIDLCRQEKVSVSVVGPTAVLGRRRGAQFFHVPQLHPYRGYLPVDRGPDAGVPQLVALPHWFGRALPEYGGLLPNVLPSGFGPYPLVRLSQATGGSFTGYDRPGDKGRFNIDGLQKYLPDYRAADVVRDEASKWPIRRAVLEAAELTARVGHLPAPDLDPNDLPEFYFWLPPVEYQPKFAAIVRRDLANVRQALPLIDQAYATLARDEVEAALTGEQSPRWQASYLLARGRLAALSVRYREYAALAEAILAGRALRPDTTRASFFTTSKLRTGSGSEELRAEAWRYLDRCVQEHPNTPWAELARWERRYELGLKLRLEVTVPSGTVSGPAPTRAAGPKI